MKFLLFIGLLVAVYVLFFKQKSLSSSSSDTTSDDTMIPCAKCGTYVQTKETIIREGKHYCSRECMEG